MSYNYNYVHLHKKNDLKDRLKTLETENASLKITMITIK